MKAKILSTLALASALSSPALAYECGQSADQVDPRCFDAQGDNHHDDTQALQAAIHAAIAEDKPLYLTGTYRLTRTLVIDYAPVANDGFHITSHLARLNGNEIPNNPVVIVTCSGGQREAPKGCFYFHQEGTLFIDAHTNGAAVRVGNADFSDAHNSLVFDHLIVNNGGPGVAVQLDYVLNASGFIVADSAGIIGLDLEQVQFSTWRGAATALHGVGLRINSGYTFGNRFQAMDLEASPICVSVARGHADHNTIEGGTIACPFGISDPDNRLNLQNVAYGSLVKAGQR